MVFQLANRLIFTLLFVIFSPKVDQSLRFNNWIFIQSCFDLSLWDIPPQLINYFMNYPLFNLFIEFTIIFG